MTSLLQLELNRQHLQLLFNCSTRCLSSSKIVSTRRALSSSKLLATISCEKWMQYLFSPTSASCKMSRGSQDPFWNFYIHSRISHMTPTSSPAHCPSFECALRFSARPAWRAVSTAATSLSVLEPGPGKSVVRIDECLLKTGSAPG